MVWRRWQSLDEKFARLPVTKSRDLRRIIYGNATEVQPDKQGRILLPQYLKEHAKIQKDIVVIGARDYAEIWDRQAYEEYEKTNDFSSIEGKLDDMEF